MNKRLFSSPVSAGGRDLPKMVRGQLSDEAAQSRGSLAGDVA